MIRTGDLVFIDFLHVPLVPAKVVTLQRVPVPNAPNDAHTQIQVTVRVTAAAPIRTRRPGHSLERVKDKCTPHRRLRRDGGPDYPLLIRLPSPTANRICTANSTVRPHLGLPIATTTPAAADPHPDQITGPIWSASPTCPPAPADPARTTPAQPRQATTRCACSTPAQRRTGPRTTTVTAQGTGNPLPPTDPGWVRQATGWVSTGPVG